MEKLNNGAEIIEEHRVSVDERIVLARWDRGDGLPEFVTWSASNTGDTFSGRYFSNVVAAAADFAERAGLMAAFVGGGV